MSEHFNQLTPAEDELLAILAEECADVIQAVTKIQRHGLSSYHPDHPEVSNRAHLTKEMGDVRAALIMLCNAGIVSKTRVHEHAANKLEGVLPYMHHAKELLG